MKTVVHNKRSKDNTLHIETEGAIINVRVGLHGEKGEVTSIEVIPDQQIGEEWRFLDKPKSKGMNIRLGPVVRKAKHPARPRLSR